MMRLERRGDGQEILVQDGEHVLIADGCGDPVCACGYAPVPPVARSQIHAVSLIGSHVREKNGTG